MATEGTPRFIIPKRESDGPQGWQCPKCQAWVDVPHGLTGNEIAALVNQHQNSSCTGSTAASG